MHRLQELVRLHRMGTGAREVARLLGMSPNTERMYRRALEGASVLRGAPDDLPPMEEILAAVQQLQSAKAPPEQEPSSIVEWTEEIEKLIAKGLTARPIYDRLCQEHEDFDGSYWAVKRMVRGLKKRRGVRPEDIAIPVETAPGEVAQVDFGYVGELLCPEQHVLRRAWVFVMTLGHSRPMFARVVFEQRS